MWANHRDGIEGNETGPGTSDEQSPKILGAGEQACQLRMTRARMITGAVAQTRGCSGIDLGKTSKSIKQFDCVKAQVPQ